MFSFFFSVLTLFPQSNPISKMARQPRIVDISKLTRSDPKSIHKKEKVNFANLIFLGDSVDPFDPIITKKNHHFGTFFRDLLKTKMELQNGPPAKGGSSWKSSFSGSIFWGVLFPTFFSKSRSSIQVFCSRRFMFRGRGSGSLDLFPRIHGDEKTSNSNSMEWMVIKRDRSCPKALETTHHHPSSCGSRNVFRVLVLTGGKNGMEKGRKFRSS